MKRLKDLDSAEVLTVIGFAGVVVEPILGAIGAFFVLQDEDAPWYVSYPFVLIGLFLFAIFVISYQFVDPGKFKNGKLTADPAPKPPRSRMVLTVFFGYMLVVAGAVVAVDQLVKSQQQVASGLVTNEHPDGPMLIMIQTATSYAVSPFNEAPIIVRVNVTLGFPGRSVTIFNGTAVFTIERLDAPLGVSPGRGASTTLDSTTRDSGISLSFNPQGGFQSQAYNIFYAIQYNVSVPGLGNFAKDLKDSLAVNIEGKGLTSGWYLFFIFAGILLSFWWRIANLTIEEKFDWPEREDYRAAYLLLLPLFSAIIALVLFQQFQRPGAQVDFLTSAITGFVYGFFWESATEKIGQTAGVALEKRRTGGDSPKDPGTPPPPARPQG